MTTADGIQRPLRVSVIGAGQAAPEEYEMARALGKALALQGAVVVCGGRGGVMEGAARGAAEVGGVTIGILPGPDPDSANPWITLPLPTGMGDARNAVVATVGEAVVAVGGSWGTLSEIALARARGLAVGTLGSPPAAGLDLPDLGSAEAAAEWAVLCARASRERT